MRTFCVNALIKQYCDELFVKIMRKFCVNALIKQYPNKFSAAAEVEMLESVMLFVCLHCFSRMHRDFANVHALFRLVRVVFCCWLFITHNHVVKSNFERCYKASVVVWTFNSLQKLQFICRLERYVWTLTLWCIQEMTGVTSPPRWCCCYPQTGPLFHITWCTCTKMPQKSLLLRWLSPLPVYVSPVCIGLLYLLNALFS